MAWLHLRNIVFFDCICSNIVFLAGSLAPISRCQTRRQDEEKVIVFLPLKLRSRSKINPYFYFLWRGLYYARIAKATILYQLTDVESLFSLIWLLFPIFTFYGFNRQWKHKYVYGGKGRACFQVILDLNLLKCWSVTWEEYFVRISTCTWSLLANLLVCEDLCTCSLNTSMCTCSNA